MLEQRRLSRRKRQTAQQQDALKRPAEQKPLRRPPHKAFSKAERRHSESVPRKRASPPGGWSLCAKGFSEELASRGVGAAEKVSQSSNFVRRKENGI